MELKYEKRSSYGRRTKKIAYLKDMNLPLYEIFFTQQVGGYSEIGSKYERFTIDRMTGIANMDGTKLECIPR